MSEQEALVKATQRIADLFWTMASDESSSVSWYRSTFYAGTKDLLIKAIQATYGDVDTEKIYDIMSDSGESVAYAVDYWRTAIARHEWCTVDAMDPIDPHGDGNTVNAGHCLDHGVTFTW